MKIQLLKKNEVVLDKSVLAKIDLADIYLTNEFHLETAKLNQLEMQKTPLRTEIINFILEKLNRKTNYLEIGVRHRYENFDLVNSDVKFSVDPGYESDINDVDFKMTSDEFFDGIKNNQFLDPDIRFDVIFIDGSHFADQVLKDINNSLEYLKADGMIVMHDCNPPTEFHAVENYDYQISPSRGLWNGTTWKAFFKMRKRSDISSCCIDTDWGVGIISKSKNLGKPSLVENEFYEYQILHKNRKKSLNLVTYDEFQAFF